MVEFGDLICLLKWSFSLIPTGHEPIKRLYKCRNNMPRTCRKSVNQTASKCLVGFLISKWLCRLGRRIGRSNRKYAVQIIRSCTQLINIKRNGHQAPILRVHWQLNDIWMSWCWCFILDLIIIVNFLCECFLYCFSSAGSLFSRSWIKRGMAFHI